MSGKAVRDPAPNGPQVKGEGGFVPGAELHRSALAVLYLAGREAEQPNSPRYVVRRLLPEHADDPELRALLLRERFVAGQVRSRHLTPVVSAFDGPVPFTVMEYVQGFSLEELLRRAAGQTHWVRFMVPAVVDALTALAALHTVRDGQTGAPALSHQAPVPRHILLGLDGIARLTDLTQCVGPGLAWNQACSRRLRVWEMAPEQVLAPAHIDHRCDIFVVAATLWRVLTGNALFQASSPQDTLQRVMRGSVPSLQEAGIPMDSGMDRVLRQALARSRHQRLDSADEFAEALRRHAQQAGFWAEREEIAEFVAGQWTARMLVASSPASAVVTPAPRPRSEAHDSGVSPLPTVDPRASAGEASREPGPPLSGAHAIPSRFVPSRPLSLPPLIVRPASSAPNAPIPNVATPIPGATTGVHAEVVTAASRFGADRGVSSREMPADPLLGHTLDPYAPRSPRAATSDAFAPHASRPFAPAQAPSWEQARANAQASAPHAAPEVWPPAPMFTAPAPSQAPGPLDAPHWGHGPSVGEMPEANDFGSLADPRASTRTWTFKKVGVAALGSLLFGGFALLIVADLAAPVSGVSSPGQIETGVQEAQPSLQVGGAAVEGAILPAAAPSSEGALAPAAAELPEPAPGSDLPSAPAPGPAAATKPAVEEPAVAEAAVPKPADREPAAAPRPRRSAEKRKAAAKAAESAEEIPSPAPTSTPTWSPSARSSDQPEWIRRPDGEGQSKAAGPQLPDNPY